MFGYDIFLSEHPEYQVFLRRRNEARAAAFYAAARPLRSGLTAGARLVGSTVEALRRWKVQRQVVRELSVLSDRVLRDIGIERRDIRVIARAFAAKPPAGATLAELAPAQSVPLSRLKTAAQPARPRLAATHLAAIEGGRRETARQTRPAVRPAVPDAQRQAAAGCG